MSLRKKVSAPSEEEYAEIQERMVLLEVRRSRKDGRVLSKRILRFLTPQEEDEIILRLARRKDDYL